MGSFAGSGTALAVYLAPARRQSVACVPTSTGDLMKMRGIPAALLPMAWGRPAFEAALFLGASKFSASPDSARRIVASRAERRRCGYRSASTGTPEPPAEVGDDHVLGVRDTSTSAPCQQIRADESPAKLHSRVWRSQNKGNDTGGT
jgi:hypothetical protein